MADDKHPNLKSLRENMYKQMLELVPSSLREQVLQMWTQEIIDKRCAIVLPGVALLDKLQNGLKKHKPTEQLDENGKVVGVFWTKIQVDEKKKATEDVEKLSKLLEEVLVGGDPNDLNQFIKSRSDKGKGESASAGKPSADTD